MGYHPSSAVRAPSLTASSRAVEETNHLRLRRLSVVPDVPSAPAVGGATAKLVEDLDRRYTSERAWGFGYALTQAKTVGLEAPERSGERSRPFVFSRDRW